MRRATRQPAQRRAGFTLVELMVAMIAGSFVIVGAYYMSDVSSRMFSEQLRRAETQMTLRSATEQIRRDIGRAGYLGARDTSEMLGCDATAGAGPLGPTSDAVAPGPQHVVAARVARDAAGEHQLSLTGNLTTSEHYFVNDALPNPTSLVLQMSNEGFRRSFANPETGVFIPARFLDAFLPVPDAPAVAGRMVSATDLNTGRVFLRTISGVITTTTPPTLQLGSPLPYNASGGTGYCMNVSSIVVAPVSTFRYAIEVPDAALARVGGRTYMTGGSSTGAMHPVLLRREIDMSTGLPIASTERVVLDSVAAGGFTVHAIYDADPSPTAVNLTFTDTPETLVNQGSIRSLIIQLIVESAESREGAQAEQRKAQNARRALRFEVMMPNSTRISGAS